jgi:helix-turn-helix protein
MRLLDKQYTDTPYYGVRRMTAWLHSQGYHVHHKRVARLMQTMEYASVIPFKEWVIEWTISLSNWRRWGRRIKLVA